MKKIIKICSVALIAWLLTVGVAQASPFVTPPEENWADWETSFPYQRNIYWDFSIDPTIPPTFYNDPAADASMSKRLVKRFGPAGKPGNLLR